MRVLLDTHAFLWMVEGNARLSARAADLLDDKANEVLVSAVSAYEICLKHALGKLPQAAVIAAAFDQAIVAANCRALPITIAHAEAAGKLDMAHRDPFDRLLIAQARVERIAIVSNDRVFDAFEIERVW